MARIRRNNWMRPLARAAVVVIAAVSLAGCVVVPYGYYGPRWHPYYYR